MQEATSDYTLCINDAAAQSALANMTDCKIIAVDCEGKKLGTKIGKIGCSPPLFDILESESVIKVMFGGQKDFSRLYREQSVALRSVLDTQIADVTSQRIKGEIQGHPESYPFVHMPSGLNKCLEHHGILPRRMAEKPLPNGHLDCFAALVQAQLRNPQLAEQISRYITRYRGAQPSANDPYVGHPLLPLEILNIESGSRPRCKQCHRDLCQASHHSRQCLGCRAISTR
ncbi:hypothetical protein C8J56DRAFT_931546 [Mycena floridula]|nr:hypothetical protein C8J56DRAFT_931546 [Mycena floridula]